MAQMTSLLIAFSIFGSHLGLSISAVVSLLPGLFLTVYFPQGYESHLTANNPLL